MTVVLEQSLAMEEVVLPAGFRDHGLEVPYTPGQLAPTLTRLRRALDADMNSAMGTPQQRLGAAWTRIAELRLPRKAVPNAVLDEVERLVALWDSHGHGGIMAAAYAQPDAAVERERRCLARMLEETEAAASLGHTVEVVPTE